MDATPGLKVTLLDIQRKRGDTTAADQLIRKFPDQFWGADWPGNRRPRVYYDPRALELDGPGGVLYAKAVVADEETIFITSANLTAAACDRNIGIDLLYRDRALSAAVLSPLPGINRSPDASSSPNGVKYNDGIANPVRVILSSNLHPECAIDREKVGIGANPLGVAGNEPGNDARCGEGQADRVASVHGPNAARNPQRPRC